MNPIQNQIISLLKKSKSKFTINEISELVQVDRHTAGKYLESLEATGICQYQTRGKSKLWSLTPSPLYSLISKDNPVSNELKKLLEKVGETVTFQDTKQSIIWSNKPEQIGKKCYEIFAGKTAICENCELESTIEKEKERYCICKEQQLSGTPIKDEHNRIVAIINMEEK